MTEMSEEEQKIRIYMLISAICIKKAEELIREVERKRELDLFNEIVVSITARGEK